MTAYWNASLQFWRKSLHWWEGRISSFPQHGDQQFMKKRAVFRSTNRNLTNVFADFLPSGTKVRLLVDCQYHSCWVLLLFFYASDQFIYVLSLSAACDQYLRLTIWILTMEKANIRVQNSIWIVISASCSKTWTMILTTYQLSLKVMFKTLCL